MSHLVALTEAELRAAGLSRVWPLAIRDRVKFSELDALNHVNNAAYMLWYENIRVRYFQDCGLSKYRPDDPRIVIRRGEIDYLQEMVQGEDYIVTVRAGSYRTTSFSLLSEVWAGGTLRSTFKGVIVLLKPDGSGKMALPEAFRARIVAVDGAKAD